MNIKLPNSQRGFTPLIILVVVALISVAAGGGYYLLSKNKSIPGSNIAPQNIVRQINKTPYQELEEALTKVSIAKTAYIDYKTKVNSRITITKTGITKSFENNVDGYLTGSTDGKTSKAQMRIYSSENPSTSITADVISTENEDIYLKGPATKGKWQKFTKPEFEVQNNKTPTDASLYGFEILSTIFSEDKALFKAIKKETVQKLPDQVAGDKTLTKYEVEISVVDFVGALRQDKDRSEKDINEAQIILKDAIIKTTYSVDKNSGYVTKMVAEVKNLTQIPTTEAGQLGLSSQHDMVLTAELSRFDLPTGISAPDSSELLEDPGSNI